jgi:hypothetical protein
MENIQDKCVYERKKTLTVSFIEDVGNLFVKIGEFWWGHL